MSVTAYVMVKANTGEADRLKQQMAAIDGVERVSIVAGDVDFIVTLSVETPADVKDVAAASIQGLDGIESTQTYVAMD
ncbi:Lrp/AsnC family transcriptional regulator [Halopenitus salinus]|jgi:DNA-binding Lrp family transcriptional regulator|uniref:Lrp/AsnC family transcriptional regulator n=1 Tax=Halopenitus salinus TaxID=1198295 RepID=A0ABD5UVP6_9EURY